jgi:hypothetical protein
MAPSTPSPPRQHHHLGDRQHGQIIGTLVINAEGDYSFTAKSASITQQQHPVQQIGFHLVDGDGDTDDGL